MPLSEFLRMARENIESSEQNSTNCSSDLSSVHENNLVELVWNNGQIMMQGHSNRARKNPKEVFEMRDNSYSENASNPKVGKFAAVQSLMDDVAPSVPSAEILNHDNDIEPWLNNSIHDNCAQAYFADLLPEISGVTGNEPSLYGSFASMDKTHDDGNFGHLHNVPMNIRVNSELPSSSKICSSSTGLFNPYETNQGESSVRLMPSSVSHLNSSTKNSNVCFGNSNQGETSENAFMSILPEKQSMGKFDSGSRVLNFSNFSRPAAIYRSNLQKSDRLDSYCSSAIKTQNEDKPSGNGNRTQNEDKPSGNGNRTQNEDKPSGNGNSCIRVKSPVFQSPGFRKEMSSCNKIKMVSMKTDSEPSAVKSPMKSCPVELHDSLCQEDSIKNDKLPGYGASLAKGFTAGDSDNMPEPVLAASSVCSGNSAEMASNDQTHKRKDRDIEESDSRSEDNEEESMGGKKAAPARGVSGSKRSRAAEVHNLSERRRRDRINEKMRALQELIPNCNKADKASMLDEAIEYLKTLQLQVQVMSMGSSFCMPPMMFPTMTHMHATHMAHFPPMAGGMGFGMGMLDMNSGTPRFPVFPVSTMQGGRFPSPHMYGPNTYQGLSGQNYQFYGHLGQGIPMSVPRNPPLFSSSGTHPVSSTGVSNTLRAGIHADAPKTSQVISPDSQVQPVSDACGSNTMDHTPSQSEAANVAFDRPFPTQKDDQAMDACGSASVNLTNTKDDVSSKEGVGDRE